jgi:PAS domain S-box-containing protein
VLTAIRYFADWFIPGEIKTGNRDFLYRGRLLVLLSLVLFLLGLLFLPITYVLSGGFSPALFIAAIGSALMFFIPFILRWTRSLAVAGTLLPLAIQAIVAYDIWLEGFSFPTFQWNLLAPLLAIFLLGIRLGLISAGLVVVETVGFYFFLSRSASPAVESLLTDEITISSWIGFALLTISITVFGWLYDRSRQRALDEVRASEERYALAARGANDGLWDWDLTTDNIYFSPRWSSMLGYSPSEVGSSPDEWFNRVAPADLQQLKYDLAAHLDGRTQHFENEHRVLHRDGNYHWMLNRGLAVRDADGNAYRLAGSQTDITDRKRAEDELAEMQHRLIESREAERLLLAQELHDSPVQDLHLVDIQLEGVTNMLQDRDAEAALAEAQDTVQHVTRTLRKLCGDLRPPSLAPFGVAAAIESYANRFEGRQSDLKVELDLVPDGQALPERVRLALFRIYQQAMDNIAQHAMASHVVVRFRTEDEEIVLEVQDDGRGFTVPDRWITLARQGHLGLVGAVERAQAIGGQLEVKSAPGEGTRLRVSAPHPDEKNAGG